MAIQSDALFRDILANTQSKFHNNETSTNLYITQESNNTHLNKQSSHYSQPILNSNSQPPTHTDLLLPSQREIIEITQRFQRVQQLLLRHSQNESYLHQKIYDFKEMALDWTQLSHDFTNKINITEDLKHLVSIAQRQCFTVEMKQLLQTKFQQYYLQRHYGGLKCQNFDLNIQERGETSFESIKLTQNNSLLKQCSQHSNESSVHNPPQQCLSKSLSYFNLREQKEHISSIGGYISLANQSKLTYTQQFCQTIQANHWITVQTPKIIEIEIPLIIYKIKERIITYDQSDIQAPYQDIDQIIDKYSKPYEQLYNHSQQQPQSISLEEQRQVLNNSLQEFHSIEEQMEQYSYNNQIGSIMVDSHLNAQFKQTEVELTYSRLPQEMLMMDSFAQIGSLITNYNQITETQNNYAVKITQKVINPQKFYEFQLNCRTLTQQNLQLNQLVIYLKQQLYSSQNKRSQLEVLNKSLEKRLSEETAMRVSLTEKLNKLNPSLFQDKINYLNNQNTSLYGQIQQLMNEIRYKNHQIELVHNEMSQLKIIADKTEQELIQREQELACINKQLEQRQWQLNQINDSQEEVIKIASQTQTSLKQQIHKLQEENNQITIKLHEYQKRVENEGLNLQYEQAKQIQGIIEERQRIHNMEISEIKQKYEQMVKQCKTQIQDLKEQLKVVSESKQAKSQITCTTLKQHTINAAHLSQLQSLVKQYDRELTIKDEEILKLKQSMIHTNYAEEHQQIITKAIGFIAKLTTQLQKERYQRISVTQRLIQIDRMVNKQNNFAEQDFSHQSLIQSFALRLQSILKQNAFLKQKINRIQMQEKHPQSNSKQMDRLRKINNKLKKYTLQMQEELISISGMKHCESHKQIINSVMEQRNYYMNLLTN